MSKTFRLAARAPASVLIGEGDSFEVPYVCDGHHITLTFRTRYLDRGLSSHVPGDLWLDAEGSAVDLNSAASIFSNAGRTIAAVMAVGANARIAPLEPEIIYEATEGLESRDYFQRYLAPDSPAHTSRFFDLDGTSALVTGVAASEEFNRLVRACSQYSEALDRWCSGSELPALSHLFMGVEAIKTAAWRSRTRRLGMTKEDLANEWGFDPAGRLSQAAFLDREARRLLVFKGDDRCHQLARDTSDQFEHGATNAGELYQPASDCLVPTAQYLREAIFDVVGLDAATTETLLNAPYERPRGPGGHETYVRSTLVGTSADLAAAGSVYPHFVWRAGLKDVAFDSETRLYTFRPDHSCTASIAEGTSFKGLKMEVYDRAIFAPFVAPQTKVTDQGS